MSNREELRERLRNEYLELDRGIDELRKSAESAAGSVRLYREQRLLKAMEDRERLSSRLKMVARTTGDKRWTEAEKLWSDLRNAVLAIPTK